MLTIKQIFSRFPAKKWSYNGETLTGEQWVEKLSSTEEGHALLETTSVHVETRIQIEAGSIFKSSGNLTPIFLRVTE